MAPNCARCAVMNWVSSSTKPPRFKVSKEKALESVQKLAKEKGISLSKAYDDNGQRVPEPKPAAAPTKAKGKKEKAEKAERGPVIRKVAEELLLQVVGKDGDGRPQGRPYSDILDAIHNQFPGSQTSVARSAATGSSARVTVSATSAGHHRAGSASRQRSSTYPRGRTGGNRVVRW